MDGLYPPHEVKTMIEFTNYLNKGKAHVHNKHGLNPASPKVQLSNSFIEDLKKIFDLEPVLPVEYIDWKKNRTGITAY